MMPLPWYARLDPAQRAALPARRDALAADALDWFAPERAHIPEKTFHVVAEIVAAAAPDVAWPRLAPSVRFCVWMYLLDYYIDEMPGIDAAHLEDLQIRVDAVLGGSAPPTAGAFLDDALRRLLGQLATGAAAPALLPAFTAQVSAEVAAARAIHARSAAVRAGAPPPPADEFLRLATDGVNHTSCAMSLLLALGDPFTDSHVAALRAPLADAARAVRLANDVRTHGKDEAEGRLHTLRYFTGAAAALAEARTRLAAMDAALDAFEGAGGPAASAAALRAITHIGVQVYAVGDIKLDI